MLTVFKYPIQFEYPAPIELPAGAEIVAVQIQTFEREELSPGFPYFWALVDTEAPTIKRRLFVSGTGHLIGVPRAFLTHLGTWQAPPFVWHLFEDNREEEPDADR